jgi:hypothetical protein
MQIIAWKCTDTGKLYDSYSSYKEHRLNYIDSRRRENRRNARIAAIDALLANSRKTLSSFDSVGRWMAANVQIIYERSILNQCTVTPDGHIPDINSVAIESVIMEPFQYNGNIRITHYAPIGQKPIFFNRDKSIRSSYPGLESTSVTIKFDQKSNIRIGMPSLFSIFEGTGINLNGGSGWLDEYRTSISLFFEDWPGLYEEYISRQTLKILSTE